MVRLVALVCGVFLAAGLLGVPPTRADEKKEPGPSAKTLDLRIVSFNAWLIPLFSKKYTQRLERLPKALQGLEADVLCLQEVWSPKDQETLTHALADSHPHVHQTRSGLLLLSRFKIASSHFRTYAADDELPPRERLVRKGYLVATLETPVGAVRVATSHLAAMPQPGGPRSRQLRTLLEHLDASKTAPLILAADLNMPQVRGTVLTDDYRRLCDGGYEDANPPLRAAAGGWRGGEKTWHRWPRGPRQGHRRDYVVYRSGRSLEVSLRRFRQALADEKTALSDHNAQVADLRLVRVDKPADKPAGERADKRSAGPIEGKGGKR